MTPDESTIDVKQPSKRSKQDNELDTSKPSAIFKPTKGRPWTLSIALPGSFIANTNLIDQKYDLAARIARAAAVFCVDEIVIFDDAPATIPEKLRQKYRHAKTKTDMLASVAPDAEPWENPDLFLFHLLSFLECPGHLRTHLFPEHPNLKGVAKLPTLDMPHHMKAHEWCQYREGVALPSERTASPRKPKKKSPTESLQEKQDSTLIECGLPHPVRIPHAMPEGMRVTLKFSNIEPPPSWPNLSAEEVASLEAEPVTPDGPREEAGYYWGYQTRRASSLSEVYEDCPYVPDGYDISIGTSERGVPLSSILPNSIPGTQTRRTSSAQVRKLPPKFQHLLLVFGSVSGLEPAVANDPVFKEKGLTKETAHEAFDRWVDLVPGQGSRTIRTEEAVWIGLTALRSYVESMM